MNYSITSEPGVVRLESWASQKRRRNAALVALVEIVIGATALCLDSAKSIPMGLGASTSFAGLIGAGVGLLAANFGLRESVVLTPTSFERVFTLLGLHLSHASYSAPNGVALEVRRGRICVVDTRLKFGRFFGAEMTNALCEGINHALRSGGILVGVTSA